MDTRERVGAEPSISPSAADWRQRILGARSAVDKARVAPRDNALDRRRSRREEVLLRTEADARRSAAVEHLLTLLDQLLKHERHGHDARLLRHALWHLRDMRSRHLLLDDSGGREDPRLAVEVADPLLEPFPDDPEALSGLGARLRESLAKTVAAMRGRRLVPRRGRTPSPAGQMTNAEMKEMNIRKGWVPAFKRRPPSGEADEWVVDAIERRFDTTVDVIPSGKTADGEELCTVRWGSAIQYTFFDVRRDLIEKTLEYPDDPYYCAAEVMTALGWSISEKGAELAATGQGVKPAPAMGKRSRKRSRP
jgi:hypothetical protein